MAEEFEFTSKVDSARAADYLETLAQHIRDGSVQLAAGGEAISLAIGTDVKLEIAAEANAEKGKGSLQFELSWKTPAPVEETEIHIGAVEEAAEDAEADASEEEEVAAAPASGS